MEKGYLLGQITISDKSHYKLYDSKIGNVIEKFGGRYLVKNWLRMVKEGNPSFQRDVLVEFKDIKTARRFSSQQFKEISKFRKAGSSGFLLLLRGKLSFKIGVLLKKLNPRSIFYVGIDIQAR